MVTNRMLRDKLPDLTCQAYDKVSRLDGVVAFFRDVDLSGTHII